MLTEDATHMLHSLEDANLWQRARSQRKRTTEAKAGPKSVFWIKQEIFLVMYSKSLRQSNLFYWRESSADIMPNVRNFKYHITLTFQCGFFLRLEDTIETTTWNFSHTQHSVFHCLMNTINGTMTVLAPGTLQTSCGYTVRVIVWD